MDFSKLPGFKRQPDNISDAVKELIKRGNITIAEFEATRMNSYERDAIIPAMSRELLIKQAMYTLKNCSPISTRCAATYDEALQLYAAELVQRLKVRCPVHSDSVHVISKMIYPTLSTNDVAADVAQVLDTLADWLKLFEG